MHVAGDAFFLGQEEPHEEAWQPTAEFLPGDSHGQRSLAGCSPWGRKELDLTKATKHACAHVKWLTSSICWEWGEELVLIRAQRYCSVYPLRRNQDPAPRLLLPYFCIPSLPWLDCSNLLFQILKDDAVKALHSICQQICKTQQWPQDWQRSLFIPIPKKDNAKECSNYHTIALISHTAK